MFIQQLKINTQMRSASTLIKRNHRPTLSLLKTPNPLIYLSFQDPKQRFLDRLCFCIYQDKVRSRAHAYHIHEKISSSILIPLLLQKTRSLKSNISPDTQKCPYKLSNSTLGVREYKYLHPCYVDLKKHPRLHKKTRAQS